MLGQRMNKAQVTFLADGMRLHLHHGPIDMIVDVTGPGRQSALARAAARFDTLLEDLVAELPRLRAQKGPDLTRDTAQRMQSATDPFRPAFITPMAAVAGAGADTVLQAICAGDGVEKAYVNNGGDVALFLAVGHSMNAAIAGSISGQVVIRHEDPTRGIASSGWRGRSDSLGIADNVTVLAATAAQADAAATMIANAVDLPGHPAITRAPANARAPDSDLGARLVTRHVGRLTPAEMDRALDAGARYGQTCLDKGLIHAAILMLGDQFRTVGAHTPIQMKDHAHA